VTQRRGDAARGECKTVKGLHCERGAAASEQSGEVRKLLKFY